MSQTRQDKRSIRYRQFSGGYAQVPQAELLAILEGYRRGIFRRNEIRVFAGRLEKAALHHDSKVSLYRIINCRSQRKGNRRLSESEIQTVVERLESFLPVIISSGDACTDQHEPRSRLKPVARKVLRHIARGAATTVEALLCFTYFLRRIPQRKPMQRLLENEHYARFTYTDFQEWTGVHRGTASRILKRLIDRGYLNTLPISKQNENRYGQLFIDGPMISLVRLRQKTHRRKQQVRPPSPVLDAAAKKKKSTPSQHLINSPLQKRSTLIKTNPKTENQEGKGFVLGLRQGFLGRHGDPELQRIALRAAQMAENVLDQAA